MINYKPFVDVEIDPEGHLTSNIFTCPNKKCSESNFIDKWLPMDILMKLSDTIIFRCNYCNEPITFEINSINYKYDGGKHITRDDWW